MTKGCLQCDSPTITWKDCESDEFYLDTMLSDILTIEVHGFIIEIFYGWFRENVKNDKAYKTLLGKIYSSGIAVGWYDDEIKKRLAISCGCKEEELYGRENIITALKFWGYLWEDEDYHNKRFLVGPVSPEPLPVELNSSDKRVIRREMEQEIEKIISNVYKELTRLARDFDTQKKEINLPDSNGLQCLSRADWE